MFTNALAAAAVTLLAWMSNVTFANATWPEGEICAAPRGPYGEEIAETCGSGATLASIDSTRARTAGSVTRPLLDRDHDLLGVARRLRRVALEQVDGVEALRAGQT